MKFTHVLFDLDGTLVDSGEGILRSIRKALDLLKEEQPSDEVLKGFIGPPLLQSFMDILKFDEEKAKAAVEGYRSYYTDKGIFECCLYDGVKECIDELKKAGVHVVLATSKPLIFAKKILEKYGLLQEFAVVMGSELDGTRIHKHEVIECALKEAGVTDKSKALMVGDTVFDVVGAKDNGIRVCGVLYGFGKKQDLLDSGADYVVETLQELLDIVLERA